MSHNRFPVIPLFIAIFLPLFHASAIAFNFFYILYFFFIFISLAFMTSAGIVYLPSFFSLQNEWAKPALCQSSRLSSLSSPAILVLSVFVILFFSSVFFSFLLSPEWLSLGSALTY